MSDLQRSVLAALPPPIAFLVAGIFGFAGLVAGWEGVFILGRVAFSLVVLAWVALAILPPYRVEPAVGQGPAPTSVPGRLQRFEVWLHDAPTPIRIPLEALYFLAKALLVFGAIFTGYALFGFLVDQLF